MRPWKPLAVALLFALGSAVSLFAEDGDLDNSFDGNGRATVAFDLGQADSDAANAVAQFPDGRIVAAGDVQRAVGTDVDFGVTVFEPGGAPDSNFSADGKTQMFFDLGGDKADLAHSVVAMKDGRVVMCGIARYGSDDNYRTAVARLDSDGSTDTSFGDLLESKVALTPFDYPDSNAVDCRSVIVDEANRIVVPFSFQATDQTGLLRLEEDGDLDPTFAGDGISEMPSCGGDEPCEFRRVIALPDGKYMAFGYKFVEVATNVFASHLFVARYTSAGVLDNSFSGDGLATIHDPEAIADQVGPIALDPAGRVVLMDLSFRVPSVFVLTRLTSNGTVDPSFGTSGWSSPLELKSPAAAQQTINGLWVQGDGKIVVTGDFQSSGTDWDCAAMRLNSTGTALDTTFDGDGRQRIAFDLGGSAFTDHCFAGSAADGRPVLAGSVLVFNDPDESYDFAVARLANAYVFFDGFESASTFFWSSHVP